MSFILRVVFSGLCAFVPLGNGELLVLLVDATASKYDHVKHEPRLTMKLKNMIGDPSLERLPDWIEPDATGDEVGVFKLNREMIMISDGSGQKTFRPEKGLFLGQNKPMALLPDRDDLRWVVESKRFMGEDGSAVDNDSAGPPWENVIAAVKVTSGSMRSLSIVKSKADRYIVWDFLSRDCEVLHSQALADKVVLEIPITVNSIVLPSSPLEGSDLPLPLPRLSATVLGEVVEVSITNLPLERQTKPEPEPASDFALLCESLAEHKERCSVPKPRPGSESGAGSGIICPMLMFQP